MPAENETDAASLLSTTPEVEEQPTQSIAQRLMAKVMDAPTEVVEKPKEEVTTTETTPVPEEKPGATETSETKPDAEAPTEPKAKAKWGELKAKATRADELEKIVAEKDSTIAEKDKALAELSKVDPARYEKALAEKDQAILDYEKRIAIYDVRESKEFKQEILAPMAKIGAKLERLAASYSINAEELKDALTISDPKAQMEKLSALTADMDPLHKAEIWSQVEKTQELYDRAAEMESRSLEAKKELEFVRHEDEKRASTEREQRFNAAYEAVKTEMVKALPILKDEAIAKQVFAAKVDTNDLTRLAFGAYAGEALKHVLVDNNKKTARIAELEKELATRSAVSPKAGAGAQQSPPQAPVTPKGSTLMERAKEMGIPIYSQGIN